MTRLLKTSETYEVIAKYLKDSLGFETKAIYYAGTHSSNGLTPIVHYDIEYMIPASRANAQEYREARITVYWNRATVYWNNDVPVDASPTITRMDVV